MPSYVNLMTLKDITSLCAIKALKPYRPTNQLITLRIQYVKLIQETEAFILSLILQLPYQFQIINIAL